MSQRLHKRCWKKIWSALGPEVTEPRSWLAAIISGGPSAWSFKPLSCSPAELVAAAQQEGVVALVNERLKQTQQNTTNGPGAAVSQELCQAFALAAREEVFVSMLQEAESRRLLAVMGEAKVAGLFLKGSSLAYWAYSEPHLRACGDVDILLPSREAADEVSRRLCAAGVGYQRANTSGELVAYELMCSRQMANGASIDMDIHWRLVNSALFANTFTFDELMESSIPLPRLSPHARGLGAVHACVHACMHRASNLSNGVADALKWLYDLEVLMALFKPLDWQQLTAVSIDKGLAGVVLSGLKASATSFGRILPEALVETLQHAERTEAIDAQRLSDWRYMQRKAFDALPTTRLRLRWLWQRVFPSHDYMVCLYGGEDRSYVALLAQRFKRVLQRVSS